METDGAQPQYPVSTIKALLIKQSSYHWITSFVRIFEGFVSWRGGMDATVYFSDTTDGILFGLSIFKFATMIIADVFMIWRLYFVWEKRKSVLIVPTITLSGLLGIRFIPSRGARLNALLVTSVGGMCNVQLLPHNPQFLHLVPDERRAIQAWKTANTACAIWLRLVLDRASPRTQHKRILHSQLIDPHSHDCIPPLEHAQALAAGVGRVPFRRHHFLRRGCGVLHLCRCSPSDHVRAGAPPWYLFVDCAPEAAALSMALICVRPVLVRYGAGAKCGGGAAADAESGGARLAYRRVPPISSAGPTATSHLDSGAFKAYSKDHFEASDGPVERATKAESTSGGSDMTTVPVCMEATDGGQPTLR
ncbi:hypothetical protein EV122DRAFT_251966 [Schizophyllum commune]